DLMWLTFPAAKDSVAFKIAPTSSRIVRSFLSYQAYASRSFLTCCQTSRLNPFGWVAERMILVISWADGDRPHCAVARHRITTIEARACVSSLLRVVCLFLSSLSPLRKITRLDWKPGTCSRASARTSSRSAAGDA